MWTIVCVLGSVEEIGETGGWSLASQSLECEGREREGEGQEAEFQPREIHMVSEEEFFICGNGLLYRYTASLLG